MRLKNVYLLFLFFILVFLIEWIGYRLNMESVNGWYLLLRKPYWNPPSWVFGPVWTILYISIGLSGWLVLTRGKNKEKKYYSFLIYGFQLFCNLMWSYFFFYLKSPGIALLDIFILVVLILMNIRVFLNIYKPAGILLIPYFLWTIYALTLNAAIWNLNR